MSKSESLKLLSFFLFPAIVFFFDVIVNNIIFNVYEIFPWIDVPMHFIGGISVGYMSVLFLRYFKEKNLIVIKNKFLYWIIIVSAVSLIAVLWEFWEYFMVNYFGFDWILDYKDTLLDLFVSICGGFFSAIVFRKV